jgi:hypothetical protein
MNTTEQIAIMKYEARLANRANAEGIRNWTPEARAASLATRRANGSVWGWNHRKRAMPSTSEAFDRSMEAMTEDAETVRSALASQRAGVPTIGARSKYADQVAEQRLEDFKAWLAELKRTDDAIADFNEIVAVMGGMTSGIAKAQRGQTIGPDYGTPAAESAARKASAVEKSIRRNFEKRNADYLRENPDERGIMLDMVAEKAEYYSASPAQKVEMEKDAYRQIRDNGSMNMREKKSASDYQRGSDLDALRAVFPDIVEAKPLGQGVWNVRKADGSASIITGPSSGTSADRTKRTGADYGTLLDAKRNYVRERDAVRPQLQADEVAYPAGNGIWIGRLPNGDERVISADPGTGGMHNRWSPAARAASLAVRRAKGSVWGWDKRKRASPDTSGTNKQQSAPSSAPSGDGKSMKDYIADGFSGLDPDWAAKTVRRIEERESWGKKLTTDEERLLKEYNAYVEEMNKKGGDGKEPVARLLESGVMTSNGPVKLSGSPDPEESEQWDNMVSGFKTMIGKGAKPTLANLQKQFEKDHDEEKFKLASAALAEAYNTDSLDKFQDEFERDPKNNSEFRTFQKKNGVPPEFIGGN